MNNTKSIHVKQEITQTIHGKSVDQKVLWWKEGKAILVSSCDQAENEQSYPSTHSGNNIQ